jgi:choline dehydrogenase-like flavoprotein
MISIISAAPTIRVKARKEVILSAGSFNSPQLLMLSGIGDKQELAKAGIPSILHLPDVGKNGELDRVGERATYCLIPHQDRTTFSWQTRLP